MPTFLPMESQDVYCGHLWLASIDPIYENDS